jgi:anthranilate phosphoribosyltransferase
LSLLPYLHRVAARDDLSSADAREAMLSILGGDVSTTLIAAFLAALSTKGETSGELLGFATAMREKGARVDPGLNGSTLLDTCGTGGDGAATFNISTVAAFVVAAAGVHVAKHGNRSLASQCGSADILEALGVRISLDADASARAIREVGIGFLFAPMLHPAMKFAQPARLELKMRTVFNLLGPLTNPARASAQLIGAPSASAAKLMAGALAGFEPRHAFVVHGAGGLDEISTTGPTLVLEIRGSQVEQHTWTPSDFGIAQTTLETLRGGDRTANCGIAREILAGRAGPQRDIVLVNAAAALVAAGRATGLLQGMALASESIDSGRAARKVQDLAAFTQAQV